MQLAGGPRTLQRDTATWTLYASLGVLGFLLNGLGAVLAPLQTDLGVDRADVAFYPSLFAAGLIAVGLLGDSLTRSLGRRRVLRAALAALAAGALLLAVPWRPLTLVGAALLGAGGALMVQVVPAALQGMHGGRAPAALGEANAVSSSASVVAPLAVAAGIAVGAGWKSGYLLAVPVALVLLVGVRTIAPQGAQTLDTAAGAGLEPGPMLGRWVDVLLAVSVEFCLVFWASDALIEWHGAGSAVGPAVAALFLLGMAIARSAAAPLTVGRHPLVVLVAASLTTAAGFFVFWAAPWLPLAGIGLLTAGLGLALLYPVTLARVVAAWPHAPERAAARGALASGLAIGVAPLVLARLADAVGLRAAYLIVPALLAVLLAHSLGSLPRRR